jgi:hypothetical protein
MEQTIRTNKQYPRGKTGRKKCDGKEMGSPSFFDFMQSKQTTDLYERSCQECNVYYLD